VQEHTDMMNSILGRGPTLTGSEQEFDKRPILCGFPKKHEFGLGDSHALSLEQQVA
jgi:hypothetical protein